jgi:hypothetical protein
MEAGTQQTDEAVGSACQRVLPRSPQLIGTSRRTDVDIGMSARAIANFAFKLLGILAIIQSIRMLPEVLSLAAWGGGPTEPSVNISLLIAAQVLPFLLLLAGGFVLVVRSSTFARLALADSPNVTPQLTAADLHSILFSSVGVLLIGLSVGAVPRILYNFAVLYSGFGRGIGIDHIRVSDNWIWLLGTALQGLLGVLLLLKGSSLVSVLRRRFDRARVLAADGQCPHCGYWLDSKEYRPGASVYICSNCKQELSRETVAPESN